MDDERFEVGEYLAGPERSRAQELAHGVLREPPAPLWGHQAVVVRTVVLLDQHVRQHHLGRVSVSPADVVLDADRALVVQPDVFFIASDRLHIVRDVVWGAPDLVVEVVSRRTAIRDRRVKLRWYRDAGVRECWLLDPPQGQVVVVNLSLRGRKAFAHYRDTMPVRSAVLPLFEHPAASFFD